MFNKKTVLYFSFLITLSFFTASVYAVGNEANNLLTVDSDNSFAGIHDKSPDQDKPKPKPKPKPKTDTPKKSEPAKTKSAPPKAKPQPKPQPKPKTVKPKSTPPKTSTPKRSTPKRETPKYEKSRSKPQQSPQPLPTPKRNESRQRSRSNQEQQNKYKKEYDRANNPYQIEPEIPRSEGQHQRQQRLRNEARGQSTNPQLTTPAENINVVKHQALPINPEYGNKRDYRIDEYIDMPQSELVYTTSLKVTSEPSGAIVTWNAKFQGHTPLLITDFQKGSGMLVVKMEGCDTFKEKVRLRPEETTVIHVNLPCESGRLEVTTYPHFADVYLDGEYMGNFHGTPVLIDNITPGYHEVRASLEDYHDTAKIVNVYSGRTITVPLVLSPQSASGSVFVESSPPGADIYIDGEYTGLITPATITNLLPGTYWISARKVGSGDASKVAMVQVGTTTGVYLQLNDQFVVSPTPNQRRDVYFPFEYGLESPRNYYPVYNIPPILPEEEDDDVGDQQKRFNTWMYTIGGNGIEEAHDAIPTWDGGYLVAGHQEYDKERDAWIVKTNSAGRVLWARSLHARGWDNITSVALSADTGFVVAGYTSRNELDENGDVEEADGWLVKLDSLGYQEWSRTYGGSKWDGINDVISLRSGGFIISGKTESEGKGGFDGWAIKTNRLGYVEWSRRMGGVKDDEFTSVLPLGVGNGYLLAGNTESMGQGQRDGWIVKVDSSGLVEWNRTYGRRDNDEITSVIKSSHGNGFVFAGSQESGSKINAWVTEVDSTGEKLWDKTFKIDDDSHIHAIKSTFGKGYVVCGKTRDFSGQTDGWVGLIAYEGKKKWIERFTGANEDVIYSVIPTLDHGFVLAGYTLSHGSYPGDAWMIKTDKLGKVEALEKENYSNR